jgi:hypothetical protein
VYSGNQIVYLTATDFSGNQDVCTIEITTQISNSSLETACDEFLWDGETYSESGIYSNTYTTTTGCDSTVTINLTILDETSSYDTVVICESYNWNGNTYVESGSYTFETINANQCDSTVYLELNISQVGTTQFDGANVGVAESNLNPYIINNSNDGSIYHWIMSLDLGTIESANLDSSQINITWGNEEGITNLCVYEEDEFGCIGQESCLEIEIRKPVNINDYDDQFFVVYPNPFKQETTLEFANPFNLKANIVLIDTRGRIIRSYKGINNNKLIIKKQDLSSGLYYLELEMDNNRYRNTIVIE